MQAQKVTVTITVEVLSIDSVAGLVMQAINNIQNEYEIGSLAADDGDVVAWETEREQVTF